MHTGEVRAKCINACLAPVASLDCCSVVTVEGLGDCVKGFNPVQGMRFFPPGNGQVWQISSTAFREGSS